MIRRTIVRLTLLLVVAILVLLVVADRLTESAASHAVAVKARQAGQLADDPSVSIAGFPFLTQVLRGRYTEVDVTTHGIHRSGLRLETVTGRFDGVAVGIRATLDGDLAGAHVEHATGEVVLSYADLDAFLRSRALSLRPAGVPPSLELSGRAVVGKATVPITGPATVTVAGGVVSIRPTAAGLRASGASLTASQAAALAVRFTVSTRLASLPFGIVLRTATVGAAGITLRGTAVGLAVPVPADAAQTAVR